MGGGKEVRAWFELRVLVALLLLLLLMMLMMMMMMMSDPCTLHSEPPTFYCIENQSEENRH